MMTKKAPLQTRDVGEMGEGAFRNWCQRRGLSINDSKPDRMGWDFFVEFEPETIDDVARDRQHILKSAFVQVKSSDSASNSVRAKLSALKRLADKVEPAFILALEFAGNADPVRGRLLRIGERQISAILKRMREAENDGRLDFYNIDLSLSLAEASEISPDGNQIADELYAVIPDDMTAHAADKQRWRDSCGNDNIAGSFSISSEGGGEDLVDLFVGKRKTLVVNRFVVKRSRFGITLPSDITEHLQSEISVSTHGSQVTVRGWDEHKFNCVEVPATLIVPPIFGIPDRLKKIRVYNNFMNCVLSFSKQVEFQIELPSDSELPIFEASQMLNFISLLTMPRASVEIEINPDITIPLGTPSYEQASNRWLNMAIFVNLISSATARSLQLPLLTTISELSKAFDNSYELFCAATQAECSFRFTSEHAIPKESPTSGDLYFPFWIPLQNATFQSVVRSPIRIRTLKGKRVRLITGVPFFIEQAVVPTKTFDLEKLNRRTDFHCQIGEKAGFAMKPRKKSTEAIDHKS